jgi:hypothetical protein
MRNAELPSINDESQVRNPGFQIFFGYAISFPGKTESVEPRRFSAWFKPNPFSHAASARGLSDE